MPNSLEELKKLKQRALLHDAEAQYMLGHLYEEGQFPENELGYQITHGVEKDVSQALYWYSKAAEQDEPKAQYALGRMYATGEGVKQDIKKAKVWYGKSCYFGEHKACKAYVALDLPEIQKLL